MICTAFSAWAREIGTMNQEVSNRGQCRRNQSEIRVFFLSHLRFTREKQRSKRTKKQRIAKKADEEAKKTLQQHPNRNLPTSENKHRILSEVCQEHPVQTGGIGELSLSSFRGFEKGVGGRGVGDKQTPQKQAKEILQECVPLLLRGIG